MPRDALQIQKTDQKRCAGKPARRFYLFVARRQSNPANAETVAMVLTFLLFEKSQYQNVRLRGLILRERAFFA